MNYSKRITGTVILLAVILFTACKGGKSGGGGKDGASKYDLSFSALKGPAFTNTMDMDMRIETEAMGMKINMDMKMNGGMRFDVLPDSAGLKHLKMTYEDMKMSMKMPALGGMGAKGDEMNDILAKMMSAFNGFSIEMLVDSTGAIKDVLGKEQFREHLQQSMDSVLEGRSNAQVVQSMEQFYDKEQLQNMVGTMFTMYSNGPVAVGDSWTRDIEQVVNNMKTKNTTKYTLVSVKDGVAEIECDGKLSGAGSPETDEGTKAEAEINGTQKGTLKIQVANGHLVSGDIKMDMDAKIKTGGMKMPMKMKGIYTFKGK